MQFSNSEDTLNFLMTTPEKWEGCPVLFIFLWFWLLQEILRDVTS